MERNKTIDLAKGIAISLVVIGHCYSAENYILQLIYAFHMPFFFIVSGMLYADKWKHGVHLNLAKSAKRLLIPYAVFEVLFSTVVILLGQPDSFLQSMMDSLFTSILPGIGVTATWYLPCSLLVYILFGSICKCTQRPQMQMLCVGVLTVMGLVIPVNRWATVLWRSMVGVGFFSVGFYGKNILTHRIKGIWLLCLTGIYLLLVYANGQVSLVSQRYSNPLLYLLNGILGSYLLIQAAQKIPMGSKYRMIENLGRNSVVVLCTHMIVVELMRVADYKIFANMLPRLGYMEGIIFGVLVLSIIYPMIPVSNRYCKTLFGK